MYVCVCVCVYNRYKETNFLCIDGVYTSNIEYICYILFYRICMCIYIYVTNNSKYYLHIIQILYVIRYTVYG